MTSKTQIQLIQGLAALTLFSCLGTDVGNGFVDIDFALFDSSRSTARAIAAPPGINVDRAWVAVERMRLRDAANCNGNSETEFVGPFAVDMLKPGAPDGLSGLAVPLADYCRFELRWDTLETATPNAPAELVGASLLLEGTRLDRTRFVLRSERGDELRLDAKGGSFAIDVTTTALFVAFDVQLLFDAVDLDSADIGNDGVIRIEEGSNEDLLATFDDNLANAAKLFGDDDGDKELDPDERDTKDVLAE